MNQKRVQIAIVGAGPSGFYAARALSKELNRPHRIDIIDRLPTPFGLVRGGVAPDHQSIKRVSKSYERLLRNDSIRFIGNICLGRDLTRKDLERYYHAIIYATGNESARSLHIPGEDLDGVHSATEFVFWYNGHPDYRNCQFRLEEAKRVAIIGNGNVALDVARILAKKTTELAHTDIADYALQKLSNASIEEIIIVGRRGPAQSSFSPKELQELASVNGIQFIVSPRDIQQSQKPDNLQWVEAYASASAKKNLSFLTEQAEQSKENGGRKVRVLFHLSPTACIGSDNKLTHLCLRRNALLEKGSRMSAIATDEKHSEPIDLVFKAIGYRGIPIPSVPFDHSKGIIPNVDGRVVESLTGRHLLGNYVVGWAKRGPNGLLGTNRPDAEATVTLLLADIETLLQHSKKDDILPEIREKGLRCVSKDDWNRIDQEELRRGKSKGKIREKFTDTQALLAFLET
ncbi:MAG: FAD-dependent oxidoreductase [Myxococcota bacterium]|nr:FAD-dependent oxidoreductase [Myxococcota bacterium]